LTIAGNAPPGVQNLALLAVDAGYSDQQHLTHDCKRLAGLPPLTLLREGRGVVRFLQDRSSAACSYPSR